MKTLLSAVLLLMSANSWAWYNSDYCHNGPVNKDVGGLHLLMYTCEDGHSVVAVVAPDNHLKPAWYEFAYDHGRYRLVGEGSKAEMEALEPARLELSKLSNTQIEQLYLEVGNASELQSGVQADRP